MLDRARWEGPGVRAEATVEPIIRKLRIQTYKAQVAARERMSESLAKEFEAENKTAEQKAEIGRQWDRVINEEHTFQLMLDLMERQERDVKIAVL